MSFDIAQWLRDIHLEEYLGNFEDAGFDDLETLAYANDEDFAALNITKVGHRQKLMLYSKKEAKIDALGFDVVMWLEEIKLQEYIATFTEYGFDDPNTIAALTKADLETVLHINKSGHRIKLTMEAAKFASRNLNHAPSSSPVPSPVPSGILQVTTSLATSHAPTSDSSDPLVHSPPSTTVLPPSRKSFPFNSGVVIGNFAVQARANQCLATQEVIAAIENTGSHDKTQNALSYPTDSNYDGNKEHHSKHEKRYQMPKDKQTVVREGGVVGAVGGLHKPVESLPFDRQQYPSKPFIKESYNRTPFERQSFSRTPFEAKSFVPVPFVKKDFCIGTLEITHAGDKVIGKHSDGTTWTSNTTDGIFAEFDARETGRKLWHEYQEQTRKAEYERTIKAQENKHNLDEGIREMEHNQNQASLAEQHANDQRVKEQEHNNMQEANEILHNEKQNKREEAHNKKESQKEKEFNEEQCRREYEHSDKMVRAHIDGGINDGALAAFTISVLTNLKAYFYGQKSGNEAAMDVFRDTGKGAATGGAMGFVTAAVQRATGVNVGGAIPGVFLAIETCQSIFKWYKGEISVDACAASIAKSFVVKAAGMSAAAVVGSAVVTGVTGLSLLTPFGLIVWAVPIVAGAITYQAGAKSAEYLFERIEEKIRQWFAHKAKIEVLRDAYAFLGVNSDDPDSVIERAFRDMAKKWHPDKGGDAEQFVKLGVYMEIIRSHRVGKAYFKEETLLAGYKQITHY